MSNFLIVLLSVLVLVPIVGAFLSYPLRGRKGDWIPGIFAGITLIVGIISVVSGYPQKSEFLVNWFPWLESNATKANFFGFLVDPLTSLMLIVITAIGFLVVVYSAGYLSPKNRDHAFVGPKGNYYFWLLLFIGSMIGVVISPSFLQLFIFWEMTTLCSWALISYNKDDKSLFSGFKALIITHIGGIALLIGLTILFVSTRSFAFDALDKLTPSLRTTVFILILIAAWAKAAQIPFYTWLPDAMVAPTPVSAYLHAAAMVKAGVYLAARTTLSNPELSQGSGLILAIMAVITIIITVILYFVQDDLKRLLAFSTIGHLGYILFGVSLLILGSPTGFRGGVLHIINHACGKGLLFLSVGAIAYATGTRKISELSGLGRKMPLVSIAFIIGLFAVTGVPPLSCFWSKFMMFTGAFEIGGAAGYILGVLVIIESLVAFAWYLFVGHRVFFGAVSEKAATAGSNSVAISLPLIILMILCFLAPIIGFPLVQHLG
ncbi:hypothetical protein FJZ31_02890 [Candidatus Poribacteria bacterium]|nr:hypothetical protein [Candidatus Poribacteria bacterium]